MSGIELINGSWDFFPLAHLYNAGMLNNHMESSWTDMETLLSIHGRQYLLLPESDDAEMLYRRIKIAQGESILNYAKNPRHDWYIPRRNPVKKVKPASLIRTLSVLCIDRERAVKEEGQIAIESINSILKRVCNLSRQHGTPNRKSTQDPAPSHIQLLMMLQDRIKDEELHLHFHYHAWWARVALVPVVALNLPMKLGRLSGNSSSSTPNSMDASLGEDIHKRFWDVDACKITGRWAPLVSQVLQANARVNEGLEEKNHIVYRDALKNLTRMLWDAVRKEDATETTRARGFSSKSAELIQSTTEVDEELTADGVRVLNWNDNTL
jgi:hypothetical protein